MLRDRHDDNPRRRYRAPALTSFSAVDRAGLSGLNGGQDVECEKVANVGKTSAQKCQSSTLILAEIMSIAGGANRPLPGRQDHQHSTAN